jgi:SAM-dependent MidA family methyltransferase
MVANCLVDKFPVSLFAMRRSAVQEQKVVNKKNNNSIINYKYRITQYLEE